jgi:molybdopterin converting factor small subunit
MRVSRAALNHDTSGSFAYLSRPNLANVLYSIGETAMSDDKDKSIIERTIETAKEIASSVSDVAKHVMEPEPLKDGDEIIMMTPMPMAEMGMLGTSMTPQFVIIPGRKKSRTNASNKKVAKKAAKKTAQRGTRTTKKLPKKAKKTAKKPKRAVTKKRKKAKRAR